MLHLFQLSCWVKLSQKAVFSLLFNCVNSASCFIVSLDSGRMVTYFSLSLNKLPSVISGCLVHIALTDLKQISWSSSSLKYALMIWLTWFYFNISGEKKSISGKNVFLSLSFFSSSDKRQSIAWLVLMLTLEKQEMLSEWTKNDEVGTVMLCFTLCI